MKITHVVRAQDVVYLCNNTEGRLTLTYKAWHEFMQKRGTLSIPFHLNIKPSNVTNMQGDEGWVITNAINL